MPQNTNPVPLLGVKTVNVVGANGAGQQVKSTRGILAGVTVNTAGTGSTLTFYDGTSTSGTKLGALSTTAQVFSGPLNWAFATGLFVVATGTVADVTISYT